MSVCRGAAPPWRTGDCVVVVLLLRGGGGGTPKAESVGPLVLPGVPTALGFQELSASCAHCPWGTVCSVGEGGEQVSLRSHVLLLSHGVPPTPASAMLPCQSPKQWGFGGPKPPNPLTPLHPPPQGQQPKWSNSGGDNTIPARNTWRWDGALRRLGALCVKERDTEGSLHCGGDQSNTGPRGPSSPSVQHQRCAGILPFGDEQGPGAVGGGGWTAGFGGCGGVVSPSHSSVWCFAVSVLPSPPHTHTTTHGPSPLSARRVAGWG